MAEALLRDTHGKEGGSTGSSVEDDDTFSKYPPAQFTIFGVTIAFPVLRIQESGGNRIIERKRPYRNGAKLDDTGAEPRVWTLDAIFNSTLEIGKNLLDINSGLPLYPDALNFLIENAFTIHGTGDLVVPTIGPQRARATSYTRSETMDERDQALVTFVFTEDNEDNVNFGSTQAPTAGANAARLGNTLTDDVQKFGSWSDALLQLQSALLDLEALVNGPGDLLLDIESAALRVQGAGRRAVRTMQENGRTGRNLFLDPANSRGERKTARSIELAARAAATARRGKPQLTEVVFREGTSIFRIGANIGQDPGDLIGINPDLDPNFIPVGTTVKVFATEALLNGVSSAA